MVRLPFSAEKQLEFECHEGLIPAKMGQVNVAKQFRLLADYQQLTWYAIWYSVETN